MTIRYGRGVLGVALGLFLLGVPASAGAQKGEAKSLVEAAIDALPRVPFVSKLKLTTHEGWVRELEMRHKRIGDADASYLEVKAPDELEGTRFLFFERPEGRNEQYIKVAASRQVIAVLDEVRKQPFLGSEFYVSDLVLPEIDHYTYRFVGEATVLEHRCKLVEMVPKKLEDELYGKTVICIDPSSKLILARKFFDHKGRAVKSWEVEKIEKIDGVDTLMRQRMRNLAEKRSSTVEVEEVRYNADVPDGAFQRKHLTR